MSDNRYPKPLENKSTYYLKEKSIHFGFAILKTLLAFNVIISHCFKIKTTKNKFILFITKRRRIHVPSFVIMSFYFNYNMLISTDSKKKLIRFERLLIPYIGWPIIIYIFSNIFKFIKRFNRLCSFRILILQLITAQGNGLLHFWYLLDLILTTFIFHFIIITFRNNYIFVLNLLLLFSYFLQYSKYNRIIHSYIRGIGVLERENEIIPFAISGFTLSALNILEILSKHKIKTFIISLIIYNVTQDYQIFANFYGVAYNGIKLNVISVCIVIIFSLIPLKKLRNKNMVNLLKYMTSYSGGIFYIHQAVQFYFKYLLTDIKNGTFLGIIFIYLISHLICIFGSLIFMNTKARNLFS